MEEDAVILTTTLLAMHNAIFNRQQTSDASRRRSAARDVSTREQQQQHQQQRSDACHGVCLHRGGRENVGRNRPSSSAAVVVVRVQGGRARLLRFLRRMNSSAPTAHAENELRVHTRDRWRRRAMRSGDV